MLIALVLGACSGPVRHDPPVDAISIDADPRCGAGLLCLAIAPIDGVSALPAGRIAVAMVAG